MTTTDRPRIDQLAAGILANYPHAIVNRADLRAVLPDGAPTSSPSGYRARRAERGQSGQSKGNSVNKSLRSALQDFERAGWIWRDGPTVSILDRRSLAAHSGTVPT